MAYDRNTKDSSNIIIQGSSNNIIQGPSSPDPDQRNTKKPDTNPTSLHFASSGTTPQRQPKKSKKTKPAQISQYLTSTQTQRDTESTVNPRIAATKRTLASLALFDVRPLVIPPTTTYFDATASFTNPPLLPTSSVPPQQSVTFNLPPSTPSRPISIATASTAPKHCNLAQQNQNYAVQPQLNEYEQSEQ